MLHPGALGMKRKKGDLEVVRRLPAMRLSLVVQRLMDFKAQVGVEGLVPG
jgi:hypothetical protein